MNKTPSFEEEKKHWDIGIEAVVGIDEVGRGAFAGPIVAAGVVFSPHFDPSFLQTVNDSKLLKPQQRETLSEIIKEKALFWAIESVDTSYINRNGTEKANSAVFRKVLKKIILQTSNYFVLIDGFHKKYLPGGRHKQKAIVKGDQRSLSIASASIIAKVHRDSLMIRLGELFPAYQFANHKGYGTKQHRIVIRKQGVSPYHRTVFCQKYLS